MTPQELDTIKVKVQLQALRVVLRGLYTGIANSTGAGKALREEFARLRQEHSTIVLKGVNPAYSDMLAAEYQSALDDLLTDIESGLKE